MGHTKAEQHCSGKKGVGVAWGENQCLKGFSHSSAKLGVHWTTFSLSAAAGLLCVCRAHGRAVLWGNVVIKQLPHPNMQRPVGLVIIQKLSTAYGGY